MLILKAPTSLYLKFGNLLLSFLHTEELGLLG